MYIVYKEIIGESGMERWFYGAYDTHEIANEVAYLESPHGESGIWFCVCPLEQAEQRHINNLFNNGLIY